MLEYMWPRWLSSARPPSQAEDEYGLRVIADGPDSALVDIVAVHGLGGSHEATWTADNGAMWLRDFLTKDIPNARISTYSYDSRAPSSRYLMHQTLFQHGEDLVSKLASLRKKTDTQRRPIIFICHSLGGVVVKSSLIQAKSSKSDERGLLDIHQSTCGIMFLGTPHQGSDAASWSDVLKGVIEESSLQEGHVLHRSLSKETRWLELQLEQFKSISTGYSICSCYETQNSRSTYGDIMIVPKSSAIPAITVPQQDNVSTLSLERDHRNLVKFRDKDRDYERVLYQLRIMCETDGHKVKEELRALTPVPLDDYFDVPPTIPCRRNKNFSGRELALEQLDTVIRSKHRDNARRAITVVTGIEGIGKTELVREYVYRHQNDFKPILWINAQSLQSAQAAFLDFAQRLVDLYAKRSDPQPSLYRAISRHLGMEDLIDDEEGKIRLDQQSPDSIVHAVKQWFGRKGNENWLIVADNVNNFELSKVSDYMPSTLLGNVILISRRKDFAHLGREFEVEALSEQESLNLFWESCGKEFEEVNLNASDRAYRIVRKLRCQPSHIAQVANSLTATGMSLDALERLLGAERQDHPIEMPESPSGLEDDGHQTSEALETSLTTLEQSNTTAADLLHLCSFMDGDSIPLNMLSWGYQFHSKEGLQFNDLVSSLSSHGLVDVDDAMETVSVHNVAQQYVRDRLSPGDQRKTIERVFILISTAFNIATESELDSGATHRWNFELQILPHILACLHIVDESRSVELNSLWQVNAQAWSALASVCERQGQFGPAKSLYDLALQAIINVPGQNAMLPEILSSLGSIYLRQGEFDEAESTYKAAESGVSFKPEDHLLKAGIKHSLATVYTGQERPDEAEKHDMDALAIYEQTLGSNDPKTLEMVGRVASNYHVRRQFEKSEALRRREALALEQKLGRNHPTTLSALLALAAVCQQSGRLDEAEKLTGRVLAAEEERLGKAHPACLDINVRLAELLDQTARLAEAEDIYKAVIEARTAQLGLEHPSTLRALEHLAENYASQWRHDRGDRARFEVALAAYEEVMEVEERLLLGKRGEARRRRPEDLTRVMRTAAKMAELLEEGRGEKEAKALLERWAELAGGEDEESEDD